MSEAPDRALFKLPQPYKDPVRKKVFSVVGGAIEKMLAIDKINHIYYSTAEKPATGTEHFAERILDTMNVEYALDQVDLERIPKTGPVVVVANHPFGGLEGLILASLLKSVRPDVKLMANFMLERIPDLRDFFIFVDPFGRAESAKINIKPLKETMAWLRNGGMLGVFPAGEVSSLDMRKGTVIDPAWSTTIARIIQKTKAPVLPVFFVGSNSLVFQMLGMMHPRLRTAMLPHQFVNKQNKTINVRVGNVIPFNKLEGQTDEALIEYLKMRTYNLKNRKPDRAQKKRVLTLPVQVTLPRSEPQAVVEAEPTACLVEEISKLPSGQKVLESGLMEVYYADAIQIPHILREIGRLREITFREVNEGTGTAIDIDRFDDYYVHVFIWQKQKQEVVGAYRLGKSDVILKQLGKPGLYTSTLFKYRKKLLKKISPALEMGRSFIRKEYQKNYSSLLVLWKGLAHYIAKNPDYKVLFGPVSINSQYQSVSRQLLVNFLKQNESLPDLAKLVKARKPMRMNPLKKWKLRKMKTSVNNLEEVESLISDIESNLTGVPILLRQYLRLGGKLLAFNIDPDFSYVLDGLILVDLTKTEPKVLERYMGREQTKTFLAYHGVKLPPATDPAAR